MIKPNWGGSSEKSFARDQLFLWAMFLDPRDIEPYIGNPAMEGAGEPHSFFYDASNALIFEYMQSLWLKHGSFDIISVVESMHATGALKAVGGAQFIADITDVI